MIKSRSITPVRVVIIGSGNVAEALVYNIADDDNFDLVGIVARNRERGRWLASLGNTKWGQHTTELSDADIYIIAVSDSAVESVAKSNTFPEGAIVVHTAGSVPLEVLPERGGCRGILYAFQSFSSGRKVKLSDVTIFIEAESKEVEERLRAFALLLSPRVEYATSELRRKIHLAGVFVNNFANHMWAIGRDMMVQEGLSFDVLKPLIAETAAKALSCDDPKRMQTGPAVRGDRGVIERHLEMLGRDKRESKIYNEISESIWETSKRI